MCAASATWTHMIASDSLKSASGCFKFALPSVCATFCDSSSSECVLYSATLLVTNIFPSGH